MSNLFDWKRLEQFCSSLFERVGTTKEEADLVAESLVQANLRGVDSHGVVRADIYLQRLKAGLIKSNGKMNVTSDGSVTLLDGQNHFGAVIGNKALELVLEGTKNQSASIVGVKGSNHFGTCSYYLLKAVKEDIILIVMSNASQTMPPTGGIRPFLGTNPFSVGVPAGKYEPFILDMATSVVARGKIINAAQKGEDIPENWAVDKDGNPTTDANAALEGAVLPLGGPKGYALSMVIDILSGVLTGAGFGKYVNNMYENWKEPQNVGHIFIGIDISKFMSIDSFKSRVDQYISQIKSEPKALGVSEILIPGEIEFRCSQNRKKNGIELPAKVVEELRRWGEEYHLDLSNALLVNN